MGLDVVANEELVDAVESTEVPFPLKIPVVLRVLVHVVAATPPVPETNSVPVSVVTPTTVAPGVRLGVLVRVEVQVLAPVTTMMVGPELLLLPVDELAQRVALKMSYLGEHPMLAQPWSHPWLVKTVLMAGPQPHDCVRGMMAKQAGNVQVVQTLEVRVMVRQVEADTGGEVVVDKEVESRPASGGPRASWFQ